MGGERFVALRGVSILALGSCAMAAACTFPSVIFDSDGSLADGTTAQEASEDTASGEGNIGAETGGGGDATTGADAPSADVGSADAGLEASRDGSADAGADVRADAASMPDSGRDATTDTGTPSDSGGATDGPNCDCAASSLYKTGVACTGLAGLLCTGTEGFSSATQPCGTSGNYVMCTFGVVCSSQTSQRVQECH